MNTSETRDNPRRSERPTFLAVSRQSVSRDLLTLILKNNQFGVEAVATSAEAVKSLRAKRLAGALIDMRVQALESKETLLKLREADSEIKLVILADEGDARIAEWAAEVRAETVLTRAFEGDVILHTVKAIAESAEGAL